MANNTEYDAPQKAAGSSPLTGSVINLIAGVWLLMSPYIFRVTTGAAGAANDTITGIIVAILAIVGLMLNHETWSRWLNFIAGIWLVISAFTGYTLGMQAMMNDIIVGLIVLGFSSWSVNAVHTEERQHRHAI